MQPIAVHKVPSDSDPQRPYSIAEWPDGRFSCACPDYEIRRAPKGKTCKHIDRFVAARRAATVRARLDALGVPQ